MGGEAEGRGEGVAVPTLLSEACLPRFPSIRSAAPIDRAFRCLGDRLELSGQQSGEHRKMRGRIVDLPAVLHVDDVGGRVLREVALEQVP